MLLYGGTITARTGRNPMPYSDPVLCPGCNQRARPPGKMACRRCWSTVDPTVQSSVYATWNRGEGAFTPEYRAARDVAIRQMQARGSQR